MNNSLLSPTKYYPFGGPKNNPSEIISTEQTEVLVIGGGIVGLAVARELGSRGISTILIEKNSEICSGAASGGNSGIGATGYDADLGSLERKLLLRAKELHPKLYREFGLTYDHVKKTGALVIAWEKSQVKGVGKYSYPENDQFDISIIEQDELQSMVG